MRMTGKNLLRCLPRQQTYPAETPGPKLNWEQLGRPHVALTEVQEPAQKLEKYCQIVETAGDAVVSVNQHHEVVYMNAAAERLFGYHREEILGGDLAPFIPPEHRQAHRHYLEGDLRTRQARLTGALGRS